MGGRFHQVIDDRHRRYGMWLWPPHNVLLSQTSNMHDKALFSGSHRMSCLLPASRLGKASTVTVPTGNPP